jgi:hypothetical protein
VTRALALAVVALGACTVERQVLGGDAVIDSCDEVWAFGEPGDACALDEPCDRPTPMDETCCIDFAYCRNGELVMDVSCDLDCFACVDDHGCPAGAAVCNNQICEPCPLTPAGGMDCGFSCPEDWEFLTRNGCPTCDCAPPSECDLGETMCMTNSPDGIARHCYQGDHVADLGCAPDDSGCSANVCAPAGCAAPAPLGCLLPCTTDPACGLCATDSCTCEGGAWICAEICVDSFPVLPDCQFP